MKLLFPLTIVAGLVASGVTASALTYSFDMPTYSTGSSDNVHGQDGWVINDLPTTGPAFPDQLSFFTDLESTGDMWGSLGGAASSPNIANVELSHSGSIPLADLAWSGDFDIVPSTGLFPGRDAFGVTLRDGASQLMRVAFEPNPSFSNQYEIVWYTPSNTRISTGFDLFVNSIYSLDLDFGTSGSDATFTATLDPGVGSPLVWGGTLTGAASGTVTSMALDFDVLGATPADAGDNYINWNNITVIPEPSSAIAGLVGLSSLLRRRRR